MFAERMFVDKFQGEGLLMQLFKFVSIWTEIIAEIFKTSIGVAIITGKMLPRHMMLGQMLDGQMSLLHLSTVKDGCTNLGR